MPPAHPQHQVNAQKQIRNAINAHWARFINRGDFKILGIDFEGSTDTNHELTAKIEIYTDNPQRTTNIRIPARDLGAEPDKWGPILVEKGQKAAKHMRYRTGMNAGRKTLDDFPG